MVYIPIQHPIVDDFYCGVRIPEDRPKERAEALLSNLPLSSNQYNRYMKAIDNPNSLNTTLNHLEIELISCFISS